MTMDPQAVDLLEEIRPEETLLITTTQKIIRITIPLLTFPPGFQILVPPDHQGHLVRQAVHQEVDHPDLRILDHGTFLRTVLFLSDKDILLLGCILILLLLLLISKTKRTAILANRTTSLGKILLKSGHSLRVAS
jgi:hypothetical protein